MSVERGGGGDSTPGSDGGERITRLFPKCRPRQRRTPNMHHLRSGIVMDARHNEINNINNLSSDDERARDVDQNLLILHSKAGSYKLRDSRIIEIAGGRELYSASRSKVTRKLRSAHKHGVRHKPHSDNILQRISNHDTKRIISKPTYPSYMNGTRAMDMLPSNGTRMDLLPSNGTRMDQLPTNGTRPDKLPSNGTRMDLSSSNGTRMDELPSNGTASPEVKVTPSQKGSPIAVVADGQVVVVDDIGQNWKGLRLNVDGSEVDGASDRTTPDDDTAGDISEPRPARVIGELPIAEYEGSPRRYGIGAAPARSPRPGFPQRVLEDSGSEHNTRPPSSTFDYLYEFSETRKVLEEFFRGPAGQLVQDDQTDFQDLDYSLVRQRQTSPRSLSPAASPASPPEPSPDASWRRRAAPSFRRIEDSPKYRRDESPAHISSNFLEVQPPPEPYERELNVVELSVGTDSVGSGAGAAVAETRPPHFALSPETTDCDSNCGDLDSELSLICMENDNMDVKGADVGVSRVCVERVSMPMVEDGLSSGHASDNDNNNLHILPTVQLSQQTRTSATLHDAPVEIETEVEPHILADLHALEPLAGSEVSPPPPAPAPHRVAHDAPQQHHQHPLWLPGKRANSAASTESVERKPTSGDDDEADTDLETDRLLGQQRTDDQGFFDDKGWRKPKSRTVMPASSGASASRSPPRDPPSPHASHTTLAPTNKDKDGKKKGKNKEVLIEGVLFRARYLGSTQLACEGQPTKATRMLQAEEAVSRIKALAPEGESQPSTEVDLFISTEKIMVLNTELKEIMMDHALRTISYIADIGELVVLMARRRFVPHDTDSEPTKIHRTPKMICHVFESEEAQFIAQSIGQAFQVAYMEFLKANGIEDHSFVKEMDYQEVLNSQEIFGDELQMFAKKELQKEVVVPKTKGEILGVVVVESGWGSMLPTVVIANLAPAGAAARCGHLNIGDQIIAINGVSLVGLPLSTCQTYIKNSKNQTVVKLTVVPCPPVVEVKIKRPDTKYQLGFSVQNGVICSLLRGGIAERGGVRVGHRIIEINSQSVVAVPHERIVSLLATSVGEILMKTMPTSMFRLLTGQENPIYI